VLRKSSHDKRVKIIARINRQHRNKNYRISTRRYEILKLIGRECVLGAGPESNQSRSINGPKGARTENCRVASNA
jgi:hypothetical protein